MKNTTTLLVIDINTSDSVIADLAESAFQERTHLSCMMIGPALVQPMYSYGVLPYGGMNVADNWGEVFNTSHKALTDRVSEIETVLARSGASADVQPLMCPLADIKNNVARQARVCDTAHIAPNLRTETDIMREVAHGILFNSPIGLMLNASPSTHVDRVFIAWNSGEAASSAVHAALPYLRQAKDVVIACFDPVSTERGVAIDPGTDVAAWLSHHGCSVTVSQFPTGGREVAQCIQERANEQGADLIVMGAYGHSRMIEAIFGGTTRTMMEQTEHPVFLAH